MKRKVITGLLTTMMVASMAMPVAAADQTTTLTTSKTSEYTLTIPASSKAIEYNVVDTVLGDLYVTGNTNVDENVFVSVTKNAFVRENSTNDKIEFSLKDTTDPANPVDCNSAIWTETQLRATNAK